MTITELKDKLRALGCDIRFKNHSLVIVRDEPIDLVEIDDGSILHTKGFNKLNLKTRSKLCDISERYYRDKQGYRS